MIVVVASFVAAAPAVGAAPAWEAAGPPIAESDHELHGLDMKRIGGVPYVAWGESDGDNYVVRVVRLAADGESWTPVGGVVNHDPQLDAGFPSLAAGPGDVPWVAWVEGEGLNVVSQIRVAHLDADGSGWDEPDPRPFAINVHPPFWSEEFHYERWISGAGDPELVFLGDRPYVAYFKNGGSGEPYLEIVRLADGGHSWDWVRPRRWDIGNAVTWIPRAHRSAVLGGRLNTAMAVNFGYESYDFRYEHDGTLTAPGGDIASAGYGEGFVEALTGIGDTPYALWTEDSQDDTGTHAYVSRLGEQHWEPVGGGALADHSLGASLRVVGGRLYAAFMSDDELFVSYLADDGNSWIPAGQALDAARSYWTPVVLSGAGEVPYVARAVVDGTTWRLLVDRLDGAPAASGSSDGEGSGPGTEPDARTSPVLAPVVQGPCGPLADGTSDNERMYGTPGPDTMRGHGGRDEIYSSSGDDCLSGGRAHDRLHGGRGYDVLRGGPGPDRLYGAAGADVLHGGDGDDVLHADDGVAEDLWCGPGWDRAVADAVDRLHGCERSRLSD